MKPAAHDTLKIVLRVGHRRDVYPEAECLEDLAGAVRALLEMEREEALEQDPQRGTRPGAPPAG